MVILLQQHLASVIQPAAHIISPFIIFAILKYMNSRLSDALDRKKCRNLIRAVSDDNGKGSIEVSEMYDRSIRYRLIG